MSTPRVAPGGRTDIGFATWGFAQLAGLTAGTAAPHLFTTLGRHRRLFRGWLHFAGRLMPGGTLPRRESELVILRVAHLRGNRYEHEHHVRLGRRAGVTDADLQRVADGPDAPGWSARERTLLHAVDALHTHLDLDDATWAQLRGHLEEPQCIELCLLVGHYEMLATTITALRIQPDEARRRLLPAALRPRRLPHTG
ncbi:carboxymuconolactone decarboxylase family protein [Rhodococcus sp. X156]|uniref:carboxymuconolactone decarboxylase family protein n=1 Tax=Rhodococcus sp. X156 TaxID=2499145 RepID=UPI000FDA4741|nr:carboxymuconolactone decarboxylase family protein [Rhodococcus sp. X156]